MKLLMLVIFILSIMSISCSKKENNTTSKTNNIINIETNPVEQLIQPINYDSFDDLINAIKNNEVPSNREEYKEEYIKYMETIYNNEYLIKLNFKDCEDAYWKTLYPKALYEDLGYSYWLKYNEKDYQIIIYYFDQDIYNEEDDTDEYIHNRMSDKTTFTNTNININNKDYTCFKTTNNQLLMKIDDVRYLWIKSSQDLDEDDALELLEKFDSFEYLYFNDK